MLKILISKKSSDIKPNPATYQKKSSYLDTEITIKDFITKIGSGYQWRAGVYDDDSSIAKKHCVGAQVLALDFDDIDRSPQEIVHYSFTVGLPANGYYYTYSDNHDNTGKYRFRVIWCFDTIIAVDDYEKYYKIMLDVFKPYGPDIATKDCSRLWFGGVKGGVIYNEQPSKWEDIMKLGFTFDIEFNGKQRNHVKTSKKYESISADMVKPNRMAVSKNWFDMVRPYCEICQKLADNIHINNLERLNFFVNLSTLDDSNADTASFDYIFNKYIESRDYTDAQIKDMKRYFLSRTYIPFKIVKYQGMFLTFQEFFKVYKDENWVLEAKDHRISREELLDFMKNDFYNMLDDGSSNIYKIQTGAGKTQTAIQYIYDKIADGSGVYVYAVPTHALAKEVIKRMETVGIPATAIRYVSKAEYTENVEKYFLLGKEIPSSMKVINKDRVKYINEITSPNGPSGVVYVITHATFSLIKEAIVATKIFIDEDCDSAVNKEVKITQNQLSVLRNHLRINMPADLYAEFDNWCGGSYHKEGHVGPMKPIVDILPYIKNSYFFEPNENLIKGLFRLKPDTQSYLVGSDFYLNLHTVGRLDTTVKLMSATPSDSLKIAFPKAEVKELPRAINEGKVIQIMGATMSKSNMTMEEKIEFVKKNLPVDFRRTESYILTFKDYIDTKEKRQKWFDAGFQLPTSGDEFSDSETGDFIHIGNCIGLDKYNGCNLLVVGKFDWAEDWYKLKVYGNAAEFINQGYDLDNLSWTKSKHIIEVNGNSFPVYLYDNELLRKLQQNIISSFLEQAIGRARTIWNKNAIYVYCDYPAESADKYVKSFYC